MLLGAGTAVGCHAAAGVAGGQARVSSPWWLAAVNDWERETDFTCGKHRNLLSSSAGLE